MTRFCTQGAAALLGLAAMLFGPMPGQARTVLKYAISDAEGPLPAAQALKSFKNYVEFESDGDIEVQAFYGTMGAARETTEQTKLGALQMTNAEDGAFGGFYPPIQALNLPYLFPTGAVAWDFLHGDFARHMAEDIRKTTELRVLAFTENGFRNFGDNVRLIKTPEDVKGLKMRVMESPVFIEFMKSLGAAATPIPINSLVLALKQGVVDGQENSAVFMVDWGIADVQKFVSMTEHVYSVQLYLINDQFFTSLPLEQQRILVAGAQLASMQNIVLRETLVNDAIKKMRDKGVEVHITTAAEKAAFRNASQPPVLAYLRQTLGDSLMDGLLKAEADAETRVYGAAEK
ncbi:MAG: DctP family TRAP transporter solute-binding subunit [Alphaproteobacteria bacterium]|nr:DctP family TRAP transporter solute-binding subunit [Alphaproteobacteria bacterium]MBV9862458.1 DctP family TRAP transporter solute-binding subunit [Alphaproteobacteria bacterium]